MSDNHNPQRPTAKYEPGTLDKTRKNLGELDEAEARRMAKVLGGEVFTEKAAPTHPAQASKSARRTGYINRQSRQQTADTRTTTAQAKTVTEKPRTQTLSLPNVSNDVRNLIDKLMMSSEYKIKPNYGFFNFVRRFRKNGTELVRRDFITHTLPRAIHYVQTFITSTTSLLQYLPDDYRQHVYEDDTERFQLLRMVSGWKAQPLSAMSEALQAQANVVTVTELIPLVKAVYALVLKIYYLGETRISAAFKDIYTDVSKYPEADKKKLGSLSRDALSQWLHVETTIIQGLYPLLMRMCSNTYEIYPQFFTEKSQNILTFLGLTKFDLLLPSRKPKRTEEETAKKPEKTEKSEKELQAEAEQNTKAQILQTGLKLLDQLFPGAGFDNLDAMPDLYPYFQPLYQFRDGFNLLDPQNPLQVTIVLVRILEDLFHACRNIQFSEDTNLGEKEDEVLSRVLSDWSLYREVLFEKNYCEELINFANEQYSKADFKNTLFGKRLLTSLLWQTKYNFLPHFKFQQLLLEKPSNDSQYRPMCLQTAALKDFLTELSRNIDGAAKTKAAVIGMQNPWEPYQFDIPNVVSKRLDVLLGAKRPPAESAATNANLIKYTLCILSVLDWWINDSTSPAYSTDTSVIYRVSEDDGNILFGVPVRKDQNKLFADRVKGTTAK